MAAEVVAAGEDGETGFAVVDAGAEAAAVVFAGAVVAAGVV